MRSASLFDLDLACIDRSLTAAHDSVVVGAVDGQMPCKRYRMEGNRPHLAFDNPELPAFALDEDGDAEVWGVARFWICWHVARAGLIR